MVRGWTIRKILVEFAVRAQTGGYVPDFVCFIFGYHLANVERILRLFAVARMPFQRSTFIGKEGTDASSYLESIALKVQELEGIMLDVEDVSALKALEFDLRDVYERAKEKAAVHHVKKQAEKTSPKTSSDVSVRANERVATPKVVEDLECIPDDLFVEFVYKP
ncbi:unnamed protein product [Ectocarpus sp. 6 AP-2014]